MWVFSIILLISHITMSSDFQIAAAIVEHQLNEANPTSPVKVKFVAPILQLRTHLKEPNPQVIRSLLRSLPQCQEALRRLPIETVTVYGMQGDRTILWKQSFPMAQVLNQTVDRDNRDPFSFNNQYINQYALPIAFALSALLHWIGIDSLLLGMRIWIHEFGHATVAWFSGRQATPLPLGWTNVNLERSLIVYCLFATLWGLLFYTGWKEKKRASMVVAGIAVVIQFCMTWLTSQDKFEMWLAFGGVGGEFYLSTLLVLAFYIPLPDKWRWDFWRYPALFMGASTFFNSFSFWHQIKRGKADIPWGTMLNGSGDAGGDMNQLRDFGWSDSQMINSYIAIGQICLWTMLIIYVLRVIKWKRGLI
jgi:hypothetical protein